MDTTHGLRLLHRCFASVGVAFIYVDHVVADDATLAALPLLLLIFDSE